MKGVIKIAGVHQAHESTDFSLVSQLKVTAWRMLFDVRKIRAFCRVMIDTRGRVCLDLVTKKSNSRKLVAAPLSSSFEGSFALTFHIHYESGLDLLSTAVESLPAKSHLFISTTSLSFVEPLKKIAERAQVRYSIVVTPNRGRNIAPLFVEFAAQLKNFEYFGHLHSKESVHASIEISTRWREGILNFWTKEVLHNALLYLQSNERFGLIYPDTNDFINPVNKYWGANWQPLKTSKAAILISGANRASRVAFPAGAVFIARTAAVVPLLEINWSFEDFPDELGQRDGTLQHGVERLIGFVTTEAGYDLLCFNRTTGEILIDR